MKTQHPAHELKILTLETKYVITIVRKLKTYIQGIAIDIICQKLAKKLHAIV